MNNKEKPKKVKKPGIIRRTGKSMFNVKQWMAWDQVKDSSKSIVDYAQEVFKPEKAEHKETFQQAVSRLNLTEEDLQKKEKFFLRTTFIYSTIAAILFCYALYLVIKGYFLVALFTGTLMGLALAYAFKQHFWYIQVKHRKLGCTVKDWLRYTFKIKVK